LKIRHWKLLRSLVLRDCNAVICSRVTWRSKNDSSLLSKYSRISFCDSSFYDDLLLRPLSSRTEHSRLVVYHCRNSSVLSLVSALLALFRCVRVSSYSILVQFCYFDCDFSTHDVHQKDRKKKINKTVDVTFFLDVFWTTAWTFFNKIKSDLIDIYFFQLSV
jgi:hypothetical protein